MSDVETFVCRADRPAGVSRRRLITVFAATLAATRVVGFGVGRPEVANAAAATTQSPPTYAGIVGLL